MALPSILPQEPGLGEKFGTGLGQGLGGLLEGLASNKLNQLVQRQQAQQTAKAFQQLPGVTPEIAQFLSALSPEERKYPLQNLGALMQLGQGNPQGVQPQASGMQALQGLQGQQSNPEGLEDQAKLVSSIFTSPHERREEEKLGIKKEELERKSSKDIRDYLAPYEEAVTAAEKNIRDYGLLEKLAKKGDIRSGATYQLLSKVGLEDLGANYNTQVAKKLIQRLAQNSRTAFGPGARITNYLERTFQGSLPSLWNTAKGIEGISKINRLMDEAIISEQQARRDLIKQNKGRIPGDIESLVRDRSADRRQKLEQEAENVALGLNTNRIVDQVPTGYKGRVRDTATGEIINI